MLESKPYGKKEGGYQGLRMLWQGHVASCNINRVDLNSEDEI